MAEKSERAVDAAADEDAARDAGADNAATTAPMAAPSDASEGVSDARDGDQPAETDATPAADEARQATAAPAATSADAAIETPSTLAATQRVGTLDAADTPEAAEDDDASEPEADSADDTDDGDDYREEKVIVVRRGVFYAVAGLAILAIAVLAGLNIYQKTKSSDPAVAVVNGTKIPRSQYDKVIARSDNGSGQTEAQSVVDQLINTALLEQDAAKQHVTASPDEIDAELKKQKANFSNDADYQTALAQAHLTEPQLRDQLKDQVLLQKLVLDKVTVSDDEVSQEYNQNKDTTYQGKQLSDVQDQIKADLLQQKQQAAEQTYFDNLQSKAKISRHIPGA